MISQKDLAELMGPHRYVVLAKTEDGDVCLCPLMLSGEETMEEAIARFKDARAVLADRMSSAGGFHTTNMDRFDGKPTAEQEAFAKRLCEQGI